MPLRKRRKMCSGRREGSPKRVALLFRTAQQGTFSLKRTSAVRFFTLGRNGKTADFHIESANNWWRTDISRHIAEDGSAIEQRSYTLNGDPPVTDICGIFLMILCPNGARVFYDDR